MEMSLSNIMYLFIGAGTGASLRAMLSQLSLVITSRAWVGTFLVNILGIIIYGLLIKYAPFKNVAHDSLVKIAFLGSLTTFSTFAIEAASLIKHTHYLEASLVVFLNVVCGIVIAVWIIGQEGV